jgi:HEPN domain-containing protein
MKRAASYKTAAASKHGNAMVASWLAKAAGDLVTAERELKASHLPNYDSACFHSQQAAEKLIKAALIGATGIEPPKVHDLVRLDGLLQKCLPGWSWDVQELSDLSQVAVEVRYPGFEATREHAREMFDISHRIWKRLRPRL